MNNFSTDGLWQERYEASMRHSQAAPLLRRPGDKDNGLLHLRCLTSAAADEVIDDEDAATYSSTS
jgi:hypothetical protein